MNKDILYPLRRLHGWLVEQRRECDAGVAFRNYLKAHNGRMILIPGTPEHTNLGDSAIVLAQKAFLESCGVPNATICEITFSQYHKYRKKILRRIGKDVLVTQLGGGNMGSQWPEEEKFHRMIVEDFPKTKMVIFPQTIYYAPDAETEKNASVAVYGGKSELTLVAREQKSYRIMGELYPDTKVLLIPDIVLSADMDTFGAKKQTRSGVLMCMRSDAERAVTDGDKIAVEHAVQKSGKLYRYMDMHSDSPVNKDNRQELVCGKMEEIAAAELVVTDRLHGMIFAAITGTPCIVLSNYNHKVKGTYRWIQHLPYIQFAENAEDAARLMPAMLEMKPGEYDNAPLIPYFEKLAEVVREYASN